MGEVSIFDFWVVLNIAVATPQAPADNCAGIGVSASAFAMETWLLTLLAQDTEVDLYCGGLDCRHLLFRFVFVFGAGAKFNRAIAVIALLHWQTAVALATVAALPIVTRNIAIMAMAHLVFVSSRYARSDLLMPVSLRQRQYVLAGADRLCREKPR